VINVRRWNSTATAFALFALARRIFLASPPDVDRITAIGHRRGFFSRNGMRCISYRDEDVLVASSRRESMAVPIGQF